MEIHSSLPRDRLLPFTKIDRDYYQRFKVLAGVGVLENANRAKGTPFRVLKPEVLAELSFGFFVAWVFSGIWNGSKRVVRASLAPLRPDGDHSVVVVSKRHGDLIAPGGPDETLLDDGYFGCPLDESKGQPLSHEQHILCPVLNRIRFNLGHPKVSRPAIPDIPSKSKECCESKKTRLWEYLERTVVSKPTDYWPAVGGAAYPFKIAPALLKAYATGAETGEQDAGKFLDEILLWFAMDAAGSDMGLPHCQVTEPFESHEIDFALYETAGKQQADKEPAEGWGGLTKEQSLCVFETTVGHRGESSLASADGVVGADPKLTNRPGARGPTSGHDHAKNKLANFLALRSLGFKQLSFNYLAVTPPGKNLSAATTRALLRSEGFAYWCLTDRFSDLADLVVGCFDQAIPADTVRSWHSALLEQVTAVAADFKAKSRQSAERA